MNTPSPVESIFFAALGKKTTAERADYLDHACGGDAELRRRVERLLMAYPQAADFMARPAVERPGGDALDREPHPPGLRPDPDLIRFDGGPTRQPGQQEDIPGRVSNDLPSESSQLLERLRAGDRRALGELFQQHRDRLRRMVELRMDARLSRAETAEVLGITEEAGTKRYIRALKKLKSILAAMPGGREGP
jgi:ECF sigma factor